MRAPLPRRHSVRLSATNYLRGTYLVTIVSHRRHPTFGRVVNSRVQLSSLGAMVESEWLKVPASRSFVTLSTFVVMPNHFHAVVHLWTLREVGEWADGVLNERSLSSVVGAFKAGVTRTARLKGWVDDEEAVWQRGFHESILRTERAFNDARTYVERNPEMWRWDPPR